MQQVRRWAARKRSPRFEIGFAVTAFVLAFALRFWLEGTLPPGFPYLTFFPAVILTGFFASTRAGAVVAVFCGLAAWYFFIAPVQSWQLNGASLLALLFYALIVATDILLIHAMRVALLKLEDERQVSLRLAQQNKTMFHELQHRVSNNLQVIASLLKMQQRNLTDGAAKQALETASARLKVISGIQRQLHNPKRQITDIGQLLSDVLPEVIRTAPASGKVQLRLELEPLVVHGDQATPVALIAVELASNALEHATSNTRPTTVSLATGLRDGMGFVRIADDGPGLPKDFQPEKSRSLGLRVAFQFAEQLGGKLSFQSDGGTIAELRFPVQAAETDWPRE